MPSSTTFGIWGDSPLANEQLRRQLRALDYTAELVSPLQRRPFDVLIAVWRHPATIAMAAEWLQLANACQIDITVSTAEARRQGASLLPQGIGVEWSGDIGDIARLARWLVDLRPYLVAIPRSAVPVVVPLSDGEGFRSICTTVQELVRLLQVGTSRFIPVAPDLLSDIRANRTATGREARALRAVVDWSLQRRGFPVADLPLRILGWGTKAYTPSNQSLHDILADPRTTSLVTVIGEPGAGKTLQLRQLDVQCALDVLRSGDRESPLETFYVPLFAHPPGRPIALDWVEELWSRAVDVNAWCSFRDFLAGGGAVIFDGYNEVGAHTQPLTQWMLEWRAVVSDCFQLGARRVIVSCRTRDQLIPLESARGEEPTAVELSPLQPDQIVSIAASQDLAYGRQIRSAIDEDPELADFYASPFRLQTYLDAGAMTVARTDARLFGMAIAGAILRERDQLHFHPRLLPERAIAGLVAIHGRSGKDPWPLLADLPLIRVLAILARTISLEIGAAGGTIDRARARAVVGEGLRGTELGDIPPSDVLDAAIDLHMMVEDERQYYGFSHRIVRQLLAAVNVGTDRVLEIIEATSGALAGGVVEPGLGVADRAGADRAGGVQGMAWAAAQLHGEDFTRRLAATDPVLAARAHAAARLDGNSDAGQDIRRALEQLLAEAGSVAVSIDVLEALAGMGWKKPDARPEDLGSTMHRIPAGEWQLGPDMEVPDCDIAKTSAEVASERRTIELPSFWIADGPVTNSEYADFIAAGGYHQRDFWTREGWDWRSRRDAVDQFVLTWAAKRDTLREHPDRIVRLLRDQLASPAQAAALVSFIGLEDDDLARHARANFQRPIEKPRFWASRIAARGLHPVVGVSWHEANAFCAWKTQQMGTLVRLPDEDEWEAACAWRLGLAPPEGPINSIEFGAGSTTPVGAFEIAQRLTVSVPKDLMGNCFEWIFDYYRPGDHVRRIVKGGSWRHEKWRAHPAYRGRGESTLRNDDTGFRYVVPG